MYYTRTVSKLLLLISEHYIDLWVGHTSMWPRAECHVRAFEDEKKVIAKFVYDKTLLYVHIFLAMIIDIFKLWFYVCVCMIFNL